MRTLKFKAKPTNGFFTTVNQMFGGFSQLSTTAERAVPYLRTMLPRKEVSGYERVLRGSRMLEGAAGQLIDGSEKRICQLSLNFRVCMSLKGAVKPINNRG